MRTLIAFALLLPFVLGSCVTTPVDVLPTDGAIGRQVERLVSRHDDYVLEDLALPADAADAYLAQSAALSALGGLPSVARAALRAAVVPVAERHDQYVLADSSLSAEHREAYLATSDQLRRLAGAGE